MFRLAVALFVVQAGLHGYTASLPVALAAAGVPDPTIGVIVGIAPLVQVPAALLAGMFVDRFGGRRLFLFGAGAYIAASTILLLPVADPAGPLWPFAVSRVFQGVGSAIVLPAALSLVPLLVAVTRQGFGLAFMGSAHNLTQVVLPPVSLAVLAASSLAGVAGMVIALVAIGAVLVALRPLAIRPTAPEGASAVVAPSDGRGPLRADAPAAGSPADGTGDPRSPTPSSPSGLRFVYRRAWTSPIVLVLLYVAHWGVVIAYLPQRAAAAGADIGLFFVADALSILVLRMPSGWLVDRVPARAVILAGIAATALAVLLLVLPPTTPVLIVAGVLSGGGAGLVITPALLELSRRSGDSDRGSAFSLLSAALASALVVGSIGAAPIVALGGFEAALAATLLGLLASALLAVTDRGFAVRPTPA